MIQSGFSKSTARVACFAQRHRPAVLVAALALMVLCFQVLPGDTLAASLGQTTVLAVIALAAVALSDVRALRKPLLSSTKRFERWIVYVLLLGLVAGVAAGIMAVRSEPLATGATDNFLLCLVEILAICLLTGVFEEGVFRVLAMDAFAQAFDVHRQGILKAAVASSVLFGLLHVSVGEASVAQSSIMWAQALLKPLQAGLFGFVMAALWVQTHNLWVIAGVHGVFNVLYLGPTMLLGGAQSTYLSGSLTDLVLLSCITMLLVPTTFAACKMLRSG